MFNRTVKASGAPATPQHAAIAAVATAANAGAASAYAAPATEAGAEAAGGEDGRAEEKGKVRPQLVPKKKKKKKKVKAKVEGLAPGGSYVSLVATKGAGAAVSSEDRLKERLLAGFKASSVSLDESDDDILTGIVNGISPQPWPRKVGGEIEDPLLVPLVPLGRGKRPPPSTGKGKGKARGKGGRGLRAPPGPVVASPWQDVGDPFDEAVSPPVSPVVSSLHKPTRLSVAQRTVRSDSPDSPQLEHSPVRPPSPPQQASPLRSDPTTPEGVTRSGGSADGAGSGEVPSVDLAAVAAAIEAGEAGSLSAAVLSAHLAELARLEAEHASKVAALGLPPSAIETFRAAASQSQSPVTAPPPPPPRHPSPKPPSPSSATPPTAHSDGRGVFPSAAAAAQAVAAAAAAEAALLRSSRVAPAVTPAAAADGAPGVQPASPSPAAGDAPATPPVAGPSSEAVSPPSSPHGGGDGGGGGGGGGGGSLGGSSGPRALRFGTLTQPPGSTVSSTPSRPPPPLPADNGEGEGVSVCVVLQGSDETPFVHKYAPSRPLAAVAEDSRRHFFANAEGEVGAVEGVGLQRLFASMARRGDKVINLVGDPSASAEGVRPTVVGDLAAVDGDGSASEVEGSAAASPDHKSSPSSVSGLGGGTAPFVWSNWEVFENHDAFPGEHATTKPFSSAEDAMRLCLKHNYSGFVVFVSGGAQMAHFRRQHRSELKEKRIRSKGAVLYVGPPATKRRLSSAALLKMGNGRGTPKAASPGAASPGAEQPESAQPLPPLLRLVAVLPSGMPPGATTAEIAKKECLRVKLDVAEGDDGDALDLVRAMGFQGSPDQRLDQRSPRAAQRSRSSAFFGGRAGTNEASPTTGGKAQRAKRVVSWRWRSLDGEIGVSALFFPTPHASAKGPPPQAIVAPFLRGREGGGEWTVLGEGSVVFEFDNSDAAHLGRTVEYAVATHDLPSEPLE